MCSIVHLNPGEIVHLLSFFARFARVWENFFRGEYLLLLLSIKKNVEAGDANVGFPLLKWFVQTVFWSLTWKPSGPFQTFLTHCSRFSGVFGKMIPPSLLLHVPFSSTFQDTLTYCRSL